MPRDLKPLSHLLVGTDRRNIRPRPGKGRRQVTGSQVTPDSGMRRIHKLMKLAEDGRRRSTVLPPLESEPSFSRSPRKGYTGNSFTEENEGGKKLRRVSMELDRKIISHLRSRHERKPSIFFKYSEIGEKVADDRKPRKSMSKSRKPSYSRSRPSVTGDSLVNGLSKEPASSQNGLHGSQQEKSFGKGIPLPRIGKTSAAGQEVHPRRSSVKGKRKVSVFEPTDSGEDIQHDSAKGEETPMAGNSGQNTLGVDGDLEQDLKEEQGPPAQVQPVEEEEEVEEMEVTFRSINISPVPTPVVHRPETREMTRLSLRDYVTQVLGGHVHRRCPPDNRVIRLYVLSGFTDTVVERTVLMEEVYPRLREFCQLKGRELEVCDLHWGLRDHVSDDHRVPEIICKTLARCQECNVGVNLLGGCTARNKCASSARSIADIEATRAERERLRQLEAAATTAAPESITAATADVTSADVREPGDTRPSAEDEEIMFVYNHRLTSHRRCRSRKVLPPAKQRHQARAGRHPVSKGERRRYPGFLEMELEQALESEQDKSHAICALRTFREVTGRAGDPAAEDYFDVIVGKTRTMNPAAAKRLQLLREELVAQRLPHSQVSEFPVEWDPQGMRTNGLRDHVVYLERLCKQILETVKRRLSESLETSDDKSWTSQLYREVAHHVRFCHERVKKFHGRKDILTIIKSYIRSNTRLPLVLYGKTGSGKSAIIAKAAKEINKWCRGSDRDIRVVVRFIGVTQESRSVRTLLRSLCLQMCHMFAKQPIRSAHSKQAAISRVDYKGLVNDFGHRMKQATEDEPLVLLLDGVDSLTDDHDGRKMAWIPRELPEHVHLVISTSPDEKLDCLPALRKMLVGKEDCLLEVSELPDNDAAAIVTHWLNSGGRCLTSEQFDILMAAFAKCPVPLFLKIAYNETLLWRSYTPLATCKLADGIKKLAVLRFGRLERDHGEPLVRRALGYVTAARHGITSRELEDLLSLDDVVMDDVSATYRPPRRRLPPLLLVRLLEDAADLLLEFAADNVTTLRWAHAQFQEAAKERYLDQRDKAPSYHKALAEYFMGTWAGKPKPFTGNEKGADRLVAAQELYMEPEDSLGDGSDRVYNLRKINEMPFHLLHAQLLTELKSVALLSFEWILAKLCGTTLRGLLEEYSVAIQACPEDQELKILSDTLHLSGTALQKDPRQLAAQLVGRLDGVIARDTPKTAGDPRKLPNILKLVEAAKSSSLPALIPSVECLTPPGGILFDLLSGHTDQITAVTLTSDGMRAVTSSLDNTIKLWDLRTGRVVRTLDGVGANVTALRTAKSNSLVVTVEGAVIRLWSVRTGACVLVVDDRPDPAVVCMANEGQTLAAIYEGTNTFRSWEMEGFKKLCEVDSPNERGVHKDRSILIADAVYNDLVLHAFRSANTATVQHARSGRVVRTLTCFEKGSSITAVAVSREYHVICCRQQYMQLHEVHVLELFDQRKGAYLRSVRGCVHDRVTDLQINLVGSHALAVCAWESQQMSDIALWNLETEDHKHLARHPLVASAVACLDFRFCLTAAKGENSLRIWNLAGKVNQPAPRLKKQLGVADVMPMLDNPRYVVAKAVNHGPISIWNVAKGKCLQAAVRVERGLTEASDAVVVRNTRLVILTERGFSSATEDPRPVFQTVLVYDLKAKRYERRLKDCYIVPSLSHEYVLLDGERLLGPSENRSHFIIWSLTTGQVVQRIKTNFKEMERRKMEVSAMGAGLLDSSRTAATKPSRSSKHGAAGSHIMTPWDRRAETQSAKKRRHEGEAEVERQRVEELVKEKENGIEQFIISGDQKKLVASFYAHHLCVFDIESQKHTQTLENDNSLLLLHVAALTWDGSHLVHANYDENDKVSYVTLWDCETGEVKKRLKRETDVLALGITNDASRIVIGKAPNQLHIWDPMRPNSLRRARGYDGLQFGVGSKIFLQEDTSRAVVFAGDISVWDLDKGTALAVFTPDTRVLCCQALFSGQLVVFGLYERQELVVLRLSGKSVPRLDETGGMELFGETTGDTTDEEADEEGE
ncbi:hypothetical protein C0Q70_04807 [Pomacea canaliculata]|uniref:AAA+ ATPase domain-containing protein n=1 Tax=Pomacea canaliculata TaxID=400727 RepID=A0A2T7PJG3_POMCA|nr:hypothetical protein C0Q70_04807 [Pomacea canaliculata]